MGVRGRAVDFSGLVFIHTLWYLAAEPLKDFSGFAAQVCLTRVSIRSSVYYSCVCMT